MDLEVEEIRPRYRLCRAGFGLMGLALGLLCLDVSCRLAVIFGRNQDLWTIITSTWWRWVVGAPITWASLLGSYLLWGRWKEPVWQKRAGLLVLLNFLDLVTWAIDHSGDLGLKITATTHPWLRQSLTAGFGWIELYLASGLAIDLILHLGHQPPEFARAAASFTLVGLTITILTFLTQTDWNSGWPLMPRQAGRNPALGVLLEMAWMVVTAVASFLVTGLCIAAAARSGEYLKELDRHAGQEHELLKSRSESENEPFGR